MSPAGTGSSRDSGSPPDDPSTFVHIGPEPIDISECHAYARTVKAGAVVQFTGTVRDHTGTAQVEALEYEAYAQMARSTIREIMQEARNRWALAYAGVVHRTGALALGEAAVCVTVAAAHRDEAFSACRYVIDNLKNRAPIWKKETLASGDERWIEESRPGA
jgi:molybdopterin synthase catalytic subunit